MEPLKYPFNVNDWGGGIKPNRHGQAFTCHRRLSCPGYTREMLVNTQEMLDCTQATLENRQETLDCTLARWDYRQGLWENRPETSDCRLD